VSSQDGSDIYRNAGGSLFQRDGTVNAMERSENFIDEVTECRTNVKAEEERVERGG